MAQDRAAAAAGIRTVADVRAKLVPVLIGAGILSYSHARCYFDAYNIKSIVMSPHDLKMVSRSRFVDYRVVGDVNTEDGLLSSLTTLGGQLRERGKVGILSGSDDWYVTILSKHKAELEEWFVVPYNDYSLIDEITQKGRFYELCEELGLPYPKTLALDCSADASPIDVESLDYPLIAKPSNSMQYEYARFPGKKKVFEVSDAAELSRIYDNMRGSDYNAELIVQDFVPGGDEGLRSLTLFSDSSGDVRLSAAGQVVLQDHDPMALGNPVCIISRELDEVVDAAARLLRHVGYRGFANFDCKYDPRDGSYRFFEVNVRPGRNTYYMTLAGFNFVTALVDEYVLGIEIPKTRAHEPFLYTTVPSYVVRRSVEDGSLRDEALSMYRSGMAYNPMFCRSDRADQRIWALIT